MPSELARLTQDWCEKENIFHQYFETIESTSDFAKENFQNDQSDLKLYFADTQSKGRGRHLNSWANAQKPGDSFLSSWVIVVKQTPQPILTPRLGLALYRALKTMQSHLPLSIKAPNDLLLEGKKIAGLLVEVIEQGRHREIIIGLGLNIFSSPSHLQANSLGTQIEKTQLLERWPSFLSQLKREWVECCNNSASQLTKSEISELLTALNHNPLLSEPYTRLEPDGTLWQSSQRTSWHEL